MTLDQNIMKYLGQQELNSVVKKAAEAGDFTMVQALIGYGASIEAAIYGAVSGGHFEIIVLCENYGTTDWDIVLWPAVNNQNLEMITFILSKGISKSWLNDCMYCAGRHGSFEILKLLTDHGADSYYHAWLGANSANPQNQELLEFIQEKIE